MIDTNTVDAVAIGPDDVVILVMIEERRCGSDPDHMKQLAAKVNAYLYYIIDGSLISEFPDAQVKTVRIVLKTVHAPSGDFEVATDRIAEGIRSYGVGFEVQLFA